MTKLKVQDHYATRPYRWVESGCGDDYMLKTNRISGRYYVYERDATEYRPKPTDLTGNPTSLGLAYKATVKYGLTRNKRKSWGGYCDGTHYSWEYGYNDFAADYIPFGAADFSNRWRTEFLLKIKGLKVNLAGYIGEYKETVEMFNFLGELLYDLYGLTKGKKPVHLLEMAGNSVERGAPLSEAWLTMQWAILPVISDLKLLVDNLLNNDRDIVQKVTARMSEDLPSNWENSGLRYQQSGSVSVNVVGYVKFRKSWFQSSTTLGNPLESIWEGTPFSFVIDAFGNIGDILSSIDALDGVESISGTATFRTSCKSFVTPVDLSTVDLIEAATSEYESHSRYAFNHFDLDYIPYIHWEPSLTLKKLFNFANLLYLLRSAT